VTLAGGGRLADMDAGNPKYGADHQLGKKERMRYECDLMMLCDCVTSPVARENTMHDVIDEVVMNALHGGVVFLPSLIQSVRYVYRYLIT
jgi:Fe2+ transport system protein B